jgi:hypothetical protein
MTILRFLLLLLAGEDDLVEKDDGNSHRLKQMLRRDAREVIRRLFQLYTFPHNF